MESFDDKVWLIEWNLDVFGCGCQMCVCTCVRVGKGGCLMCVFDVCVHVGKGGCLMCVYV